MRLAGQAEEVEFWLHLLLFPVGKLMESTGQTLICPGSLLSLETRDLPETE